MPKISSFYGITILMFFGDHHPPHFHARYGEHAARIALDGTVLDGALPRRANRMVSEWVGLHPAELLSAGSEPSITNRRVTLNRCDRTKMNDVTAVEVVKDRIVRLEFSDGSERNVDVAPLLWGPVFEEIKANDLLFAEVRVDPEIGTISWPNGADLDPDVLHGDYEPANQPQTSS